MRNFSESAKLDPRARRCRKADGDGKFFTGCVRVANRDRRLTTLSARSQTLRSCLSQCRATKSYRRDVRHRILRKDGYFNKIHPRAHHIHRHHHHHHHVLSPTCCAFDAPNTPKSIAGMPILEARISPRRILRRDRADIMSKIPALGRSVFFVFSSERLITKQSVH